MKGIKGRRKERMRVRTDEKGKKGAKREKERRQQNV